MICSGKQLNTGDGWLERTILEAGLKTGSTVEMKLAKITNEVDGISKGHLAGELQAEALSKLSKRCKMLNEEALRVLETLDGITLGEEQLEAKIKRKSVASKVNKLMDE